MSLSITLHFLEDKHEQPRDSLRSKLLRLELDDSSPKATRLWFLGRLRITVKPGGFDSGNAVWYLGRWAATDRELKEERERSARLSELLDDALNRLEGTTADSALQ